jgi:RNA polymerase sigma factor (sigma-70 family)
MELGEHLFRHESGRMVAALTRLFGIHNLTLAEDCVQDAFIKAFEVWKVRGIPQNPSAWLMITAKRRALDALRRERTARTYAPELGRLLESEWTRVPAIEEIFTPSAIKDDLLRMMFSCCHPRLNEVAQVSLMLNILCGFSVGEIAGAFVCEKAAVEKRILRAKKVLAGSKGLFDVTSESEFAARLPAVQRALYLLFNEGYHGASPKLVVRAELCQESIRLTLALLDHPYGHTPSTHALAALMCLNAARLPGRIDRAGNLTLFLEQDRSLWDRALLVRGLEFLEDSASGDELTAYHIEAAISSAHASAPSPTEINWAQIVSLYDSLMSIGPSPIVALNRAIAVGQLEGPERGLRELRAIDDLDLLSEYPFYPAALGDFELQLGHHTEAREHFKSALGSARNPSERRYLESRISKCLQ